jgi:hypothetical protein
MAIQISVSVENGVFISEHGYISIVQDGKIVREYLTPRASACVKYWSGEGAQCIGKQEFTSGSTGSNGWCATAMIWPSDDKAECARWLAKRRRMKFLG